jgi:hypothetical protein
LVFVSSLTFPTELASGQKKATVPWNSLLGEEDKYVEDEYLPEGFKFSEPSRVSKFECEARLKFWYNRQEDPKVKKTFEFHSFRGADGDPVRVQRAKGGVKGKAPKKSARGRGRKRRIEDAEDTEEDSVGDEGDGDSLKGPEEEVEEDEEDGEDEEDEEERPEPKMNRRKLKSQKGREEEEVDDEEPEPKVKSRRLKVRKDLPGPMVLPFAAVRVVPKPLPARPRPTGRYKPSTGPQFEPPNTRRRKVSEEDMDEGPSRKKKKEMEVERFGPPIGKPKDRPEVGKANQSKANLGGKGKGKAK